MMGLDLVPQQQRRSMHRCEKQFHKTGKTGRRVREGGRLENESKVSSLLAF